MSGLPSMQKREQIIVWAFLAGVTVIQGALIVWSFPQTLAADPGPLERHIFAPPGNPLAWLLATAFAAAYITYAALRSPVIRTHMLAPQRWRGLLVLRALAIVMAFVTGFFEEALFRKYLMDIAMHHGQGPLMQVVISATIFGLAHGIWGIAGGNWRAALGPIVSTALLGSALAIVYLAGGRSLAPCVFAHILINLFLEPWLIITSATNSWGRRTPP